MAGSYHSKDWHVGDVVHARRGTGEKVLHVVAIADIGLYCVYPEYDAPGQRRAAAFIVPYEDVVG
jgi:hypothetical protein